MRQRGFPKPNPPMALGICISAGVQVRNISDVVHQSNCEQHLAAQRVRPRQKPPNEKIPQERPVPAGSKPIEKKERIAKAEIILPGPAFSWKQVLGEVPHSGTGMVNALPSLQPQLPAEVDILAVHEIQAFVETAHFIKCRSSNQRCCSGTPGGLTSL